MIRRPMMFRVMEKDSSRWRTPTDRSVVITNGSSYDTTDTVSFDTFRSPGLVSWDRSTIGMDLCIIGTFQRPIHRDDASVLFGFLKDLTQARSKITDFEDETSLACLAKLNVLITFVGLYFEQANGINAILTCPSS